MKKIRPMVLLATLGAALLSTTTGDGHPERAPRSALVASAQDASPAAGPTCEGEPYIVTLDPVGPDEQATELVEPVDRAVQQEMFEAVNSRINQLQNEERIVRAIAPVIWADDGTLTVDLRLIADSRATVEAILVTPAILRIVYGSYLEEGMGTRVPSTRSLEYRLIDNSGLEDGFVTTVNGQQVLRLVLKDESVAALEADISSFGEETYKIIVDRRVLNEWAAVVPVPTALDIAIDEQVLTESEADILAVALRAGPLPAQEEPSPGGTPAGPDPSPPALTTDPELSLPVNQIDVAFLARPSEDHCLG